MSYDASSQTATLTPASALPANAMCQATIATTATNTSGIALVAPFTWTFVTAASADVTRPTVIATLPANAASAVPTNTRITAAFSEAWQRSVGVELDGKTLGVIGLGNLGRRVARVGLAFGMEVLAWSQNMSAETAEAAGAALVSLDELLERSTFVSIHLKLSERTTAIIGQRELRLLGPEGYLVNTSRGPIVDEGALVKALQEGWIAGAGLDVFDEEPLRPDHPLRRAPRTVLTPHVGYVTDAGYKAFYDHALEDVKAFLEGNPVRVIAP